MHILSGLFRSRDKPKNYLSTAFTFLFGPTSSGNVVTERTAMQTTAVYACVRVLSEAIAGLPLYLYRNTPDGGKEKAINHPLYNLLHDAPNPEMTSFIFRETLMSHLLLWGNAYAQIVRNGTGQPIALYPLLPSKMDVSRAANGQLIYTYSKDSDEFGADNRCQQIFLSQDEVLHVPGLGFDGLIGYSPIAMAKNAIGMSLAAEQYGALFFANGATPGGILEHPGIVKDPVKLRESWHAQFSGTNRHNVAVLEEGMTFQQLSIPPDQAKSTFSNIEQQSLEFVKYTLNPWCVRWEQAMNQQLVLPSERSQVFTKFNVDGLLRGDYQSRMNGYAIGRQNGWLSANDIRELEDMNRIPTEQGGDTYLVNGNMLPLDKAGKFYTESEGKTP